MKKYEDKYTIEDTKEKIEEVYSKIFTRRMVELDALITQEENKVESVPTES